MYNPVKSCRSKIINSRNKIISESNITDNPSGDINTNKCKKDSRTTRNKIISESDITDINASNNNSNISDNDSDDDLHSILYNPVKLAMARNTRSRSRIINSRTKIISESDITDDPSGDINTNKSKKDSNKIISESDITDANASNNNSNISNISEVNVSNNNINNYENVDTDNDLNSTMYNPVQRTTDPSSARITRSQSKVNNSENITNDSEKNSNNNNDKSKGSKGMFPVFCKKNFGFKFLRF